MRSSKTLRGDLSRLGNMEIDHRDTENTEAMEQGLKCFALFYEISVSFVSLWFRNGPKASN
jgi:hypothetical protein